MFEKQSVDIIVLYYKALPAENCQGLGEARTSGVWVGGECSGMRQGPGPDELCMHGLQRL